MKKIEVKLVKSLAGTTERQKSQVRGLGLRKLHSCRQLENTPAVRGMIKKVIHLLEVRDVEAK